MNIIAGGISYIYYDPESKTFKDDGTGHKFGIRSLNFWQWQEFIDKQKDPALDQVRWALEHCLADIDGSQELAAQFIANPHRHLINPLFEAIVAAALGN